MLHSTVTSKGQTTTPRRYERFCGIKPGDQLEYAIAGDHATIRVHPGTRSLKGALASKKGKRMSFAEIRQRLRVPARAPGEPAKACRHQPDRPLSGTGP